MTYTRITLRQREEMTELRSSIQERCGLYIWWEPKPEAEHAGNGNRWRVGADMRQTVRARNATAEMRKEESTEVHRLNSTLDVPIEELNAQISALHVENLRLYASEIALSSQRRGKSRSASRNSQFDEALCFYANLNNPCPKFQSPKKELAPKARCPRGEPRCLPACQLVGTTTSLS
ncbi:hypothetical protein V8E53_010401 [Lactarius tabidus]